MITHSSILTWRIPWTEEPGRLQSIGSDMTERLITFYTLHPLGHWQSDWQFGRFGIMLRSSSKLNGATGTMSVAEPNHSPTSTPILF